MDHLYLQAMMHGEFARKKNEPGKSKEEKSQFEISLEKQIDNYVDSLELEEDSEHKNLLPPKLRREKIKTELKAAAKMPELSQFLESAIRLLLSEGANYLSEETYKLLISDLTDVYTRLSSMNLDKPEDVDISVLIYMSDHSLDAIATIATDKFANELYGDCLSLFSLLSVINPGYAEYWFRLGIAAQKSGNLDLAIRGYAAAAQLDPKHIGARLFAAECYAQRKFFEEAKTEYEAAKEITHHNAVEKMWLDLLPMTEDLISPN